MDFNNGFIIVWNKARAVNTIFDINFPVTFRFTACPVSNSSFSTNNWSTTKVTLSKIGTGDDYYSLIALGF